VTRTRLLALLAPPSSSSPPGRINSVPAAEEQAKAAWANVEAAQQRRLDVLPSLARVATAASGHERELQIGVAERVPSAESSFPRAAFGPRRDAAFMPPPRRRSE
jgi:LemA protein